MNCEICHKNGIKPDGSPGGLDCPGVCDRCRRHAQIGEAAQTHAETILYSLEAAGWDSSRRATVVLVAAGLEFGDGSEKWVGRCRTGMMKEGGK